MNRFRTVLPIIALIALVIPALGAQNLASGMTWTPMPDWLANEASLNAIQQTADGIRFEVNQPGRGMKWMAPLAQPIDLAKAPWLVVRYRALDAVAPEAYFIWLSDDKHEQYVADPSTFVPDGAWHTIVLRADPVRASMAAIQLQAAGPHAVVEISRFEFLAQAPKLSPEELVSAGQKAQGKFKQLDITKLCTTGSDALVKKLNLSRWFAKPDVVASGVPFRVKTGAKALAATDADKPTELRIPLTATSASEVFLLMASDSKGIVNEPHQFSARVAYTQGSADMCVPARMPSGFGLGQGISVYAIPIDKARTLKEIVLRDNVAGTSVYLLAATVGLNTSLASYARPSKATAPVPATQPKSASEVWESNLADDGDKIKFIGGDNRATLNFQPGVWLEMQNKLTSNGSLWTVRVGERELRSTDFRVSEIHPEEGRWTLTVEDKLGLGITGKLTVTTDVPGCLPFQLELTSAEKQRMQVTFPTLPSITQEGADLSYCFPRRGSVVNNIPIDLREAYSGSMPLQFMDVYGPDGGLFLRTQDLGATYRYFTLKKDSGIVSLGVEYLEQDVDDKNHFKSPVSVVGFHQGDWHAALDAYRQWVATWYKPDAPRKDWFRQVFNFRQQFLRFYIPGGEKYYDKATKKYSFGLGLAADIAAFGGVDYLHLFDWGASEQWGRCGDYEPWDEIGGVEAFRNEVKKTQAAGVPVGLYLEGYLIDPQSRIAKLRGKEWQILDAQGKPLPFFAPAMNMCSAHEGWQSYLSSLYERVMVQTEAKGYYCDEMGFADPGHFCYAKDHDHAVAEPPLKGQNDLLRRIRRRLGTEPVLYTEETPADTVTQHTDGSFTYAISSVSDLWSPSHVNLSRFALPDFKTVEIITCDHPIGDKLTPVRQIFFNGEGIWLEGPADKWFAPEVRGFIKKMHGVMKSYTDCFTSMSPVPLVQTGQPMVFANEFPAEKRTLWTLFNANYSTVRGEVLAVPHTPGAQYIDAWNNRPLKPRIVGDTAYITLEISPRDVGCVVREGD